MQNCSLVDYIHTIRVDISPSRSSAFREWDEGTLALKLQVLDDDRNEEVTATFSKFRFEPSTLHVVDQLGCTDNQFAYAVFAGLKFGNADEAKLDLRPEYKDERGRAIPPADLVTGLSKAQRRTQNWDQSRKHDFAVRLTVESHQCPFVPPTGWVLQDSPKGGRQQHKASGDQRTGQKRQGGPFSGIGKQTVELRRETSDEDEESSG